MLAIGFYFITTNLSTTSFFYFFFGSPWLVLSYRHKLQRFKFFTSFLVRWLCFRSFFHQSDSNLRRLDGKCERYLCAVQSPSSGLPPTGSVSVGTRPQGCSIVHALPNVAWVDSFDILSLVAALSEILFGWQLNTWKLWSIKIVLGWLSDYELYLKMNSSTTMNF